MKQQKNKKILLGLILIQLFLFGVALADEVPSIEDPLGNKDISALAASIIQYVLRFVGVIALVMFIVGGITWMTSGGSAEKIKKGKDTLVWAILGMGLVFFSYAITRFIIEAFLK
ncbi:MAG: TrbC/VirB2 family protein [Patescibacteria group bacterium]|jgi:uncharacterized membrane protein YidH (DUF202 family)|nr:TrbC/VirB2 family protein [Patescibacteria group bacterium]MDD5172747.1 TrbC/VirB2 family protein [Patescibacteria group bacterium]